MQKPIKITHAKIMMRDGESSDTSSTVEGLRRALVRVQKDCARAKESSRVNADLYEAAMRERAALKDAVLALLAAQAERSRADASWDESDISGSQDRVASAIITQVLAESKAEAALKMLQTQIDPTCQTTPKST